MVYFWQKQIRNFRNHNNNSGGGGGNNSNNQSTFPSASPLISAAVTAADTAFAAVIVSKHGSSHLSPSSPASSSSTSSSSKTESAMNENSNNIHNNGAMNVSGSVVFHGGGNSIGRSSTPSSSGVRDNSTSASTSKIQSRVLDKLSEYSRRKQETNKRRVAERELDSLNMKIDKLLSKMDDVEIWSPEKFKRDDECVVCMAAPASMKTFPCGHKVVCRKCLIKTMQVAISQRCLPLRCVICRDRILSLQHAQDFGPTTTSSKSNTSTFCFEADVVNNNTNHYNSGSYYYGNSHVNGNCKNHSTHYHWSSGDMNNNNDINIPNNSYNCCSNSVYNHTSIKRGKGSFALSRSSTVPVINRPMSESSVSQSTSSSSTSCSSSSPPLSSSNVLSNQSQRQSFHGQQDHINVQSIDHWLQCNS